MYKVILYLQAAAITHVSRHYTVEFFSNKYISRLLQKSPNIELEKMSPAKSQRMSMLKLLILFGLQVSPSLQVQLTFAYMYEFDCLYVL